MKKDRKVKARKTWNLDPVTKIEPLKKFNRTTEKQKWKKQIFEVEEQ
jgi:hypothetical protein